MSCYFTTSIINWTLFPNLTSELSELVTFAHNIVCFCCCQRTLVGPDRCEVKTSKVNKATNLRGFFSTFIENKCSGET